MEIIEMFIKYNYSLREDTIKYIVIHDTGNEGYGAGVDGHFNYFNSANRNASADYFIDDIKIGMFVQDNNKSWHCGDGKGKYGITNNNSIGIELCINSNCNRIKAVNNLLWLTKYLMNKYHIDYDEVVRHYDASRKICPKTMSKYNWAEWNKFKNKLKQAQI